MFDAKTLIMTVGLKPIGRLADAGACGPSGRDKYSNVSNTGDRLR